MDSSLTRQNTFSCETRFLLWCCQIVVDEMDLSTMLMETKDSYDSQDDDDDEHHPMKPYLIAVTCISIIVGFVLLFKIYKQVKSGRLYNPCCDDRAAGASSIHRRDTFKPLVRGGSNASDNGTSIYKHGVRRPGPDMV